MTDHEADAEWEARMRWCVYCRADCWVDEPEHALDCPSSTGVYPVRAEDVKYCDGAMLCGQCSAELAVGDTYHHSLLSDEDESGPPVYLVVCAGCAAHEALAGEDG